MNWKLRLHGMGFSSGDGKKVVCEMGENKEADSKICDWASEDFRDRKVEVCNECLLLLKAEYSVALSEYKKFDQHVASLGNSEFYRHRTKWLSLLYRVANLTETIGLENLTEFEK